MVSWVLVRRVPDLPEFGSSFRTPIEFPMESDGVLALSTDFTIFSRVARGQGRQMNTVGYSMGLNVDFLLNILTLEYLDLK